LNFVFLFCVLQQLERLLLRRERSEEVDRRRGHFRGRVVGAKRKDHETEEGGECDSQGK